MKGKLTWIMPVIFAVGCVAFDELERESGGGSVTAFTIEDAKAVFETQYTAAVTKSRNQVQLKYGFNPGDFTPIWDKNRYSACEHKSGYDVSILPDRKLSALRVSYYGTTVRTYKTEVPQRLIVIKDSGSFACYLLTLIPDINSPSGEEAFHDFVPCNKTKGKFSGLAVYTLPGTNELVRVSRYKNGEKTGGVFLLSGSGSYEQRLRKTAELLSGTRIVNQSLRRTKLGEDWDNNNYDDYYGEATGLDKNTSAEYTDLGDGIYLGTDGSYYVDMDGDGFPDLPCLAPSYVQDEYPGELPDPEFENGDDGIDGPAEGNSNEDGSGLWEENNSEQPSGGSGEGPKSWKEEEFPEKDIMKDTNFVKYCDSGDCLQGCKDMMDNMGFSGEYGNSGEVIYLVSENEDHTKLENYGDNVDENYKNAVDCINEHLDEDRPIIVGADHTLGNDKNDGTIDRFVLIVGSGHDENGNYYIYVEPGTSYVELGVNPDENRFYYDENRGMFIDGSDRNGKELTITEVRPNNGSEYEVIIQPPKHRYILYNMFLYNF